MTAQERCSIWDKTLRVAIVHDWLMTYAGAERVLEQMLSVFPQADLYTLVDKIEAGKRDFILGKAAHTSFISSLPFSRKHYRHFLPLMPLAIEQFDLGNYDLIISSSHAVAKGVLSGPHQLHVCMCYSPIRYAWDLQHEYLRESRFTRGLKKVFARAMLHYIRMWDYRTAAGVDGFIAISQFIASRIWKVYRRESDVVYPPVDVDRFERCDEKESFYLTASRFVPYKRIDLIVSAFSRTPNRQLVVIGDGPENAVIRDKAGPNIRFLGYQPFEVLRDHMQRARAFVFAAREDFGIIPLEAQACGTPVIIFSGGAASETVYGLDHPNPSGVFFHHQTEDSILEAVNTFEKERPRITPEACRRNAERFSSAHFHQSFRAVLEREWGRFQKASYLVRPPCDSASTALSFGNSPKAVGQGGG